MEITAWAQIISVTASCQDVAKCEHDSDASQAKALLKRTKWKTSVVKLIKIGNLFWETWTPHPAGNQQFWKSVFFYRDDVCQGRP